VLHTSTFADDDTSCALAMAVLDIVERESGALMKDCADKGQWLKDELTRLKRAHPDWIEAVRGQGLMLGIDFGTKHRPTSPMLRMLLDEDLLAPFIAGHLLHEENIRVLPALSSGTVIRVEPSAFVTRESLKKFTVALERVLQKLEREDFAALGRFALGEDPRVPLTSFEIDAWSRPPGEA
jgi:acetylornithine/succinyldiaminopimelate/putrescine aminotransferase